jgi:hypothetical protein
MFSEKDRKICPDILAMDQSMAAKVLFWSGKKLVLRRPCYICGWH